MNESGSGVGRSGSLAGRVHALLLLLLIAHVARQLVIRRGVLQGWDTQHVRACVMFSGFIQR